MTITDLMKQVRRTMKAENGDIIDLFNRCLDDLTPVAKKEAKIVYPITPDNNYGFPNDFFQEAHVFIEEDEYYLLPLRDKKRQGYKKWDGQISIQHGPESGTIELYYYRKLNRISVTTEEPELEEPFRDLLVLYTLGQLQWKAEDYEFRPDALERYYIRKQEYKRFVDQRHQEDYIIEGSW